MQIISSHNVSGKRARHSRMISTLLVFGLGLSPVQQIFAQLEDSGVVLIAAKSKPKPTAKSLIVDMRKAVTYIASSSSMIQKTQSAKPFWGALRDTSASLDEMEKGLKAGDKRMPQGMANAGRGINQLDSSWKLLQRAHPSPKVTQGMKSLSSSFALYRTNFGPAAARAHKGGRLTAADTRSVNKNSRKLNSLRGQFSKMGRDARKNSYEEQLVLDVLNLINRLLNSNTNQLDGYLVYLDEWDRLDYALYGCSNVLYHWYPDYYNEYDQVFVSYEEYSTVYYETTWTSYEEWSYSEVTIEEYDEEWAESVSYTASVDEAEESEVSASLEAYDEEEADEISEEEISLLDQEIEVDDQDREALADEENAGDEELADDDGGGDEEIVEEDDAGDEEIMEEDNAGDEEIMEEDGGGDEEIMEEDDGGDEEIMEEDDGGGEEYADEDDGGGDEEIMEEDDGGGEEDYGGEEEIMEDDGGGEDYGGEE